MWLNYLRSLFLLVLSSNKLTPCHSPFRGITTNFSCVHIFQIFSVCQLCLTFMKLVSRRQYHYWKFGRSGLICWSENEKKKKYKKVESINELTKKLLKMTLKQTNTCNNIWADIMIVWDIYYCKSKSQWKFFASTREAWKFIAAIVPIVFIWQGGATIKLA